MILTHTDIIPIHPNN